MLRAHPTARHVVASTSAFLRAAGGHVAVVFAVVSILLVSVIGFAVDLSRVSNARAELQTRLNSALTAAVQKTPRERIAAAENFFDNNSTGSIAKVASRTFETDADGIRGSVTAEVPATLSSLLGLKLVPVAASGKAIAEKRDPDAVVPDGAKNPR